MFKFLLASLLAVLALSFADLGKADGALVSRNNPYRSFNVTGVNYGSMQWRIKNRSHSGSAWSSNRSSGRLFRRR
jgi:hypothetical protein